MILIHAITSIQRSAEGTERLLSLGEGIEREVLEAAFRVFQEDPSKWFLPRQDQHCSILTLTSL